MAIIDDIQNSEKLLDLSNQLLDSLTQRRKTIKDINADEQLYFATVKQQQRLSQDITANAEKYLGYQIKSKDLAKQIKATEDNRNKTSAAFGNISNKLANDQQKSVKEARKLRIQERDLAKQILVIDADTQKLEIKKQIALRRGKSDIAQQIQQDIRSNQLNANNLEKRSKKLEEEITKQKNIAKSTAEIIKNAKESEESQKKEIAFLNENLRVRKQIEKSTGLLGGITKAASKIPGIGQYLNADEAIDEMEKLAASIEESGGKSTSFGNRMQIAGKGLQVLAKGAYENLKSPEAVFTFFLKAALTANDQAVKLGKSLGYGADRADAFRENLAGIERASNNINVTTASLTQAFGELSEATGFAYEFSADQLETQIKLTKQVGLTADEAAQVQRFGVLTGKTSEQTYKSFVKGLNVTSNQLKVGINFKATLAEAVKVSGQLAAQLGYNPERIAKAIVTAKAFGMTLESLLNFETSIENELKAELLTGKQLNLERARAAALSGDQATVAAEIAANVGTAADFAKMNTLEQKALAEAVGMTADELANTLTKREQALASGKSLAQVTEDERIEALERQSIQDKFNAAVEKLQSLFGNILAGPLGSFLDMLSGALNIVNTIGKALSFLATPLQVIVGLYATLKGIQLASLAITKSQTMYEAVKRGYAISQGSIALGYNSTLLARQTLLSGELAKSIGIAAAWAIANPFQAIVGLALAAGVGALVYSQMDDGIIGPGGETVISGPKGSIQLDKNDSIVAGTNLFDKSKEGGNVISPSIDLTPMIAAINQVKASVDRLYSKDTSINMDGKKVGTTLTQGSYKLA